MRPRPRTRRGTPKPNSKNAEENIKFHEGNVKIRKEHIEKQKQMVKELRAKAKRGIENLRLHEQTHLDINAKSSGAREQAAEARARPR